MANHDPHQPQDRDPISGVNTTGHSWDGLKELNNPTPKWWLWVFIICCIWAVGYWVVYPAWPTLTGATTGAWGWSSREQLRADAAEILARQNAIAPRFDAASLAEIEQDPVLLAFARAGGAVAFRNHCAACHGSGAAGGPGYPNLNDDSWIWGGNLDQIHQTILHGVRYLEDGATRSTEMPAFGKDKLLSETEVASVADYVLQLGPKPPALAPDKLAAGKQIYVTNCASCHGEQGQGNRELGAPQLNDAIWLYGGKRDDIIAQVNRPKMGVMPAWGQRLDERTLKQLTVYVHMLGGGQAE